MPSSFFPPRQVIPVKITKLDPEAEIPKYAYSDDSGFDLITLDDVLLEWDKPVLARTGLAFEIPDGFELQIRPRSGMSGKYPVIIPNSPGTVDAGYRGEIKVLLRYIGNSNTSIKIAKGTKIAQGVICPVAKAIFVVTDKLTDSSRGADGFGSTGEKA